MSVLSDAKMREIYDGKGCHDAGLRAVAEAERERIYALIDTNPEHIWRDAGFMQWRAKRSQGERGK